MGFLFSAIVAIVVFIGLMFVLSRAANKENTRERLGRITPFYEGDPYSPEQFNPDVDFLNASQEKSGLASFGDQVLQMLGQDVRQLEKDMQMKFVQAGIYSPNAVSYYYLFRIIMLPISFFLAYALFTSPQLGLMKLLVMGAGVLVLAWWGPTIYLTNTKQKRQKILTRSFPDTLDLILVCVESGLALDAALARVCRELGRAHPEITRELNRTRMELTLLPDRGQALQNLAERTDLVAFRSLVAALLQTEKFGTSLTETLRVLSDDYRHSRLMAAENKAGKLPALMTIPMILLMMPAFMLIILGPAIIQLVATFNGSSVPR